MGNVAGYRAAWIEAERYRRRWDAWNADHTGDPPDRNLGFETLAEVLRGNILVHNHCYRADEMAQMIDIAKEFGYKIRSFHHGVEAYKIAALLAKEGISGSLWADWGGFKMEAIDGIKANLAIVHAAGARAIVHSDDPSGSQRLNQEAAKAIAAGVAAGIPITKDEAIKWITINAAWALGLDDRIGSIEVGKNADVVLWSGDPFTVYTRAERVWIDGALLFDRTDPAGAVAHRLRARLRADDQRGWTMRPSDRRWCLAIAAGLVFGAAAGAAAQPIAIVGGKVYPVSGPPIENATVLMDNGTITAVGVNRDRARRRHAHRRQGQMGHTRPDPCGQRTRPGRDRRRSGRQ